MYTKTEPTKSTLKFRNRQRAKTNPTRLQKRTPKLVFLSRFCVRLVHLSSLTSF